MQANGWTDTCCEGNELLKGMASFGVELALSDHVGDLDTGESCERSIERFEPFHLTRLTHQTLDEAVIP